uniref:Uncharacterized protein n=1 Tax=Cacopsylla melanoneura TaxID=428564 RepID=A0A8D8TKZ6_9HEMI
MRRKHLLDISSMMWTNVEGILESGLGVYITIHYEFSKQLPKRQRSFVKSSILKEAYNFDLEEISPRTKKISGASLICFLNLEETISSHCKYSLKFNNIQDRLFHLARI